MIISSIRITKKIINRKDQDYLVIGNNPSAQRNLGASKIKSEYILFLDEDSTISKESLQAYKNFIEENPLALIMGGPAIYESGKSIIQKIISIFFKSELGTGPFHYRYKQSGRTNLCKENKLILCNMIIQKKLFDSLEGFDLNFYPNEENEFMARAQKVTSKIYYIRDAFVTRPSINNLKDTCTKIFNYGHGRAKNLKKQNKKILTSIYIIPFLFSILVTIFPIFSIIAYYPIIFLFILYKERSLTIAFISPFVFLSLHYCYGLGIIYFKIFGDKLKNSKVEAKIIKNE